MENERSLTKGRIQLTEIFIIVKVRRLMSTRYKFFKFFFYKKIIYKVVNQRGQDRIESIILIREISNILSI